MTKRKEYPFVERSLDNDQKKDAFISSEMQLQNHSLALIHKNKSILSATSILSRSPMANNTTASLDKLTFTNFVDFGKCQDRFGRISWSKKTPTTWILDQKCPREKIKVQKFD